MLYSRGVWPCVAFLQQLHAINGSIILIIEKPEVHITTQPAEDQATAEDTQKVWRSMDPWFLPRDAMLCGICCRCVSVCVSVCHTPVLYQNG